MRRFRNGLKTAVLLGLLTGIILVAGYGLGGSEGLLVATLGSLAMNGAAYFWSDRMALATMRAGPITAREAPELVSMVRQLATAAGAPMPRVFVSPLAQPNAFATGRNPEHAAVCVTDGILRLLTPRELRAVLAHEMSHVTNRDILISSVAAGLAGIITSLAQFALFLPFGSDDDDAPNPLGALLMLILAPLAATLIQLSISRTREFEADADGARLSGDPLALASALQKIEAGVRAVRLPGAAPAGSTTAHLMIANPLSGGATSSLFRTHPPTTERVQRLLSMADEANSRRRLTPYHPEHILLKETS